MSKQAEIKEVTEGSTIASHNGLSLKNVEVDVEEGMERFLNMFHSVKNTIKLLNRKELIRIIEAIAGEPFVEFDTKRIADPKAGLVLLQLTRLMDIKHQLSEVLMEELKEQEAKDVSEEAKSED